MTTLTLDQIRKLAEDRGHTVIPKADIAVVRVVSATAEGSPRVSDAEWRKYCLEGFACAFLRDPPQFLTITDENDPRRSALITTITLKIIRPQGEPT